MRGREAKAGGGRQRQSLLGRRSSPPRRGVARYVGSGPRPRNSRRGGCGAASALLDAPTWALRCRRDRHRTTTPGQRSLRSAPRLGGHRPARSLLGTVVPGPARLLREATRGRDMCREILAALPHPRLFSPALETSFSQGRGIVPLPNVSGLLCHPLEPLSFFPCGIETRDLSLGIQVIGGKLGI